MERQAKGIWIPIEIWENKELTWNEKILFIEIDSFTTNEKDCYISNEYIAKLLGVTENSANRVLSSLINKGYVIKTAFDGRKRYVKTALSYSRAEYPQESKQGIPERIGRDNSKEYIYKTNTKTDNKEISTNVDTKKEKSNFDKFNDWLKENTPNVLKLSSQMTEEQFNKLRAKYDFDQMSYILLQMENYKGLAKKYTSVYLTFNNWAKREYGSK